MDLFITGDQYFEELKSQLYLLNYEYKNKELFRFIY